MRYHLTNLRRILASWFEAARRHPTNTALALALLWALVWIYGHIVLGIIINSAGNEEWYHCLVVPLGAAAIWYRKRDDISETPVGSWWGGGLVLVALALVFRFGEIGLEGFYFGGISLVLTIAALVALLGGRERLKTSSFAIAFLIFAVPFPTTAYTILAFPLQQIAAILTASTCHAMGIPVMQDGLVLTLGEFSATIAEACSGMNSLFALLMCGTWLVGFSRIATYQRVFMVMTIGPVMVFGNALRLVLMMVVALFFGGEAAMSFFHQGSDLVVFLILVSFLLHLKMRFEGVYKQVGAESTPLPVTWVWEQRGETSAP